MKIFLHGIIFPICFLLVSCGTQTNNNFRINNLDVSVKCVATICTTCIDKDCVIQDGRKNEKKCLKGVCTDCSRMICTTQSEDERGAVCVINLEAGTSIVTNNDNNYFPTINTRSSRNPDRNYGYNNRAFENTAINKRSVAGGRPVNNNFNNNFEGSRQFGGIGRSSRLNNSKNSEFTSNKISSLSATSNTSFEINGFPYTINCDANGPCVTCVIDYKPFCKTQNPFSRGRVCTFGVCTTCSGGICIIHSINEKCDPNGRDLVKQNPNRIVMTRIDLNKGEIQQSNGQGAYSYVGPRGINTEDGRRNKTYSSLDGGVFQTNDLGDVSYSTSKGIYNRDQNGNVMINDSKRTYREDIDGNIVITNPRGTFKRDRFGRTNITNMGNSYDTDMDDIVHKNIKEDSIRYYDTKGGYKELGVDSFKELKANGDTKIINTDGVFKQKANGDTKIFGADGSKKIRKANGDTMIIGADGSKKMRKTNGDTEIIGADGSKKIRKTNGDTMIIGAGGSKKIRKTNGDTEIIGADGSKRISRANGDTMFTRADGTTIKKMANGSIVPVGQFKNTKSYGNKSESLDFTDISDFTWSNEMRSEEVF